MDVSKKEYLLKLVLFHLFFNQNDIKNVRIKITQNKVKVWLYDNIDIKSLKELEYESILEEIIKNKKIN